MLLTGRLGSPKSKELVSECLRLPASDERGCTAHLKHPGLHLFARCFLWHADLFYQTTLLYTFLRGLRRLSSGCKQLTLFIL